MEFLGKKPAVTDFDLDFCHFIGVKLRGKDRGGKIGSIKKI